MWRRLLTYLRSRRIRGYLWNTDFADMTPLLPETEPITGKVFPLPQSLMILLLPPGVLGLRITTVASASVTKAVLVDPAAQVHDAWSHRALNFLFPCSSSPTIPPASISEQPG